MCPVRCVTYVSGRSLSLRKFRKTNSCVDIRPRGSAVDDTTVPAYSGALFIPENSACFSASFTLTKTRPRCGANCSRG